MWKEAEGCYAAVTCETHIIGVSHRKKGSSDRVPVAFPLEPFSQSNKMHFSSVARVHRYSIKCMHSMSYELPPLFWPSSSGAGKMKAGRGNTVNVDSEYET
jgi:hypothetical protein